MQTVSGKQHVTSNFMLDIEASGAPGQRNISSGSINIISKYSELIT